MDIHEYLKSRGYSRQESQNPSNDNSFDLNALDRKFSATRQDLQDPLDDYSFDLALLDRKFASKEQEAKAPVSVTTKETLVTLPPYPVKHGKAQGGEANTEGRRDLTGFEKDLIKPGEFLLSLAPNNPKDYSESNKILGMPIEYPTPKPLPPFTPGMESGAEEASPSWLDGIYNYFNATQEELAKKNREYYEGELKSRKFYEDLQKLNKLKRNGEEIGNAFVQQQGPF